MNWRKLDFILHIGYHKTGTTFLQKSVFPNTPQLLYLGRTWISNKLDDFFFDFNFTNDFDFDNISMSNRFSNIIDEIIIEKKIDLSKKKAVLISHESLHSGSDYFGSRIKEQSCRLKKVFPNAKIIISIRNQARMIESNYTNYINHGGKLTFNNFFYKSNYIRELRKKLEYDFLIDMYFKNFSESNVKVLIFEKIFQQTGPDLEELDTFLKFKTKVNFIDTSINKKLSKTKLNILRFVNIFLANKFYIQYQNRVRRDQSFIEKIRWYLVRFLKKIEITKPLIFSNKKNKFMTDNQIQEIEKYFEESNSKLAKILKIDLKKFGYKY